MIEIRTNAKGRGIYATQDLKEGQLIEECPVLLVPKRTPGLHDYVFEWLNGDALALGWGSLYNHSFCPNAIYQKDLEGAKIRFVALRFIAPNEEVLVNYNGDPGDQSPVWFTVLE